MRASNRTLALIALLLLGHPSGAGAIVFEARSALQGVLGFVQGQPPLVVLFGGLDRGKGDDDILLAGAEKPADADHETGDLAGFVDENVIDIADL